jgi:hypothetical protein
MKGLALAQRQRTTHDKDGLGSFPHPWRPWSQLEQLQPGVFRADMAPLLIHLSCLAWCWGMDKSVIVRHLDPEVSIQVAMALILGMYVACGMVDCVIW